MGVNAILQAFCLKPKYSLRRQLIISYGVTSIITVSLAVLFAAACALYGGSYVKNNARDMMRTQVIQVIRETSRYQADIFTERLGNLKSTTAIIVEIVKDRIVGYPEPGWEDDMFVPFVDMETGQRKYPLSEPLLPYDWNITLNLRFDNIYEHAQERAPFVTPFIPIGSTASGFFRFQGVCDPKETNPLGFAYHPNCTEANNDYTTGGVIHPVPTNKGLAEKSADIAVFLKSIYEVEPEIFSAGIYYHNSGAGALVSYPSAYINSGDTYISTGCEWMRSINPYTGRPHGTEEEIARCHPFGEVVNVREYNSNERGFCVSQVQSPGQTVFVGPYSGTAFGAWWFSTGQAIYDRMTGELIGCIAVDMSIESLFGLLQSTVLIENAEPALIRTDGTVVAGAGWNYTVTASSIHLTQTTFTDEETLDKLLSSVDWSEPWTYEDALRRLDANIQDYNGRVLTAYPIPVPPREYDPEYRPEFYVLLSVGGEVFEVIDEIDNSIDDDVSRLILNACLIGVACLIFMIIVLWFVSRALTLPLQWIKAASWRIVNHADKKAGAELRSNLNNEDKVPSLRFNPRTEINTLVTEFQKMINGFSGTGATSVAKNNLNEIENEFDVAKGTSLQQLVLESNNENDAMEFFPILSKYALNPIDDMPSSTPSPSPPQNNQEQDQNQNIINEETTKNDEEQQPSDTPAGTESNDNGTNTKADAVSSPDIPPLPETAPAETSPAEAAPAETAPKSTSSLGSSIGRMRNYGNNVTASDRDDSVMLDSDSVNTAARQGKKIVYSPLFWWIVAFIVVPLLITFAILCAAVAIDLLKKLPTWVDDAEDTSYEIELDSLRNSVSLRTRFAEQVLAELMRDVSFLTRVAGWILFGAVDRSSAFPFVYTRHSETCKSHPMDGSCPIVSDENIYPCDCDWDDLWGSQCRAFESLTASREAQQPVYAGQARDADPVTGNRVEATSFPRFDNSPENTLWWTDIEDMPGYTKNTNTSSFGFGTTYDRLRAISALSVAAMPLYNYANTASNLKSRSILATYFAFEADGGFWGYSGCGVNAPNYAHFVSSDANKAYEVNPELCPKGKYGYDPRCRDWYRRGKERYLNNLQTAYMTPPYRFASGSLIANSAGAPVIDPNTGELIGQTLVDFVPGGLIDTLVNETLGYFSFVISPEATVGADTVVGPGHNVGDDPKAIADVVLPNDAPNSENRKKFAEVTDKMKGGESGEAEITRKLPDGSEESIRLSYSPVYARTLTPVKADDITRGAIPSAVLLYSVGVVRRQSSLREPFTNIEEDIRGTVRWLTLLYIILIALLTIFSVYLTVKFSFSISEPVRVLLRVVRNINKGRIEYDLPPLEGGSSEVNHVYNSFSQLFQIVRVSSKAFRSGNLSWAYNVVHDALRLYRKVNDQKAISVACNNLGNTLFAMTLNKLIRNQCLPVHKSTCCVKGALKYYNETITIGTVATERYNKDDSKAAYSQQLANRLFNRAVFLLHTRRDGDPCCPTNAKETAHSDLTRARDYDNFVLRYFEENEITRDYSDVIFDRMIRRIHGLAVLRDLDPQVESIWKAKDVVDGADRILQTFWNDLSAPLFQALTRTGRLQQLEGAVIHYLQRSGLGFEAAKIGLRMIKEDEYVIDSSFDIASEAIMNVLDAQDSVAADSEQVVLREEMKSKISEMLRSCEKSREDPETGANNKCVKFCFELSDKMKQGTVLSSLNRGCRSMLDKYCTGSDLVGILPYGKGVLEQKRKHYHHLKQHLELATKTTTGATAAPLVFSSMFNTPSSTDVDESSIKQTFVVMITDGTGWTIDALAKEIDQIKIDEPPSSPPTTATTATTSPSDSVESKMHVFVVGIELKDRGLEDQVRKLCQKISSNSIYLPATRATLDSVLNSLGACFTAAGSTNESNCLSGREHLCLSMEGF